VVVVINVIVWLLVLLHLIKVVRAVSKRSKMAHTVKKKCAQLSYDVKFTRSPYASFFKYSETPDMVIKTGKLDIYVRIISSVGRRFFYFANSQYCASVSKLPVLMLGSKRALKNSTVSQSTVSFAEKIHVLPELKTNSRPGREEKFVMLFNPAPGEIHVSDGKRSVVADSGSYCDKFVLYDVKQFCNFLEYGENKDQGRLDRYS